MQKSSGTHPVGSEMFVTMFYLREKRQHLQEASLNDRPVKQGPVNNSDEQGKSRHHILEMGT